MTMTVMVADDQGATRLEPAPTTGKADDLQVITQAENGQDALGQLVEIRRRHAPRPDVILMDAQIPILNGIDTTATITRKHLGIKVLVLAIYDQDDYAFGVFGAGTSGFLLKDTWTTDLHQALQAVAVDDAIPTPRIVWQLPERHMSRTATPRQRVVQECFRLSTSRKREVAELAAQRMTNAEIGERLFVQPESVKKTVIRILVKFQLRDRVQLVIILHDAQSFH